MNVDKLMIYITELVDPHLDGRRYIINTNYEGEPFLHEVVRKFELIEAGRKVIQRMTTRFKPTFSEYDLLTRVVNYQIDSGMSKFIDD
jgi:hypothetical protein